MTAELDQVVSQLGKTLAILVCKLDVLDCSLDADNTPIFLNQYVTGAVFCDRLGHDTDPGRASETGTPKGYWLDLYWFAVALNRTAKFPDEIERWPVKMLVNFDPIALKRSFQSLAMQMLAKNSGKG